MFRNRNRMWTPLFRVPKSFSLRPRNWCTANTLLKEGTVRFFLFQPLCCMRPRHWNACLLWGAKTPHTMAPRIYEVYEEGVIGVFISSSLTLYIFYLLIPLLLWTTVFNKLNTMFLKHWTRIYAPTTMIETFLQSCKLGMNSHHRTFLKQNTGKGKR